MTSFFESLSFEGFEITDSPRIKRLHSDRAREFTALYFQKFLSNHRSIYHTLTTGYDPQANGTAERSHGTHESSQCKMSHHLRTTTRILGLCSQVCSTKPPLLITSEETEVTSIWLSSHCTGAQSQESEVS